MKIGEHKGFRADNDGRLGYVFPTIRSNTNYMLFISTNQKPATAPLPISKDTQNIGKANTTHAVIGRVRHSLKYLR